MKRSIALIVVLALLMAALPACDVLGALEITPSPSHSPAPTLTPTESPSPAPEPSPSPTLQPTPPPTPAPDVRSFPDSTVITFADPAVEKLIRTLLSKPTGDITAGGMRTITSFDYNPDIYSFAETDIYSLDDLRWCEKLDYLYVSGNQISDLTPLAGLESLRSVWIGGNPVTDASPVLRLPNLQDFVAFNTPVTDISALSGTSNLRQFHCRNKLKDYTPLLKHKGMEYISLADISDDFFQSLLTECPDLKSIFLEQSDIQEESFALLKGRSMDILELDNCGIEDISKLSGLKSVNSLRFPNNNIQDISPLKNLLIRSYLDLRSNNIRDWSPIRDMTQIRNLLITGNPVTQGKALDNLEKSGCTIER